MKHQRIIYFIVLLFTLGIGFNSCEEEQEYLQNTALQTKDITQRTINWQEFKAKFDVNRLDNSIQSKLKIDKKVTDFARSIEDEYVIDNEKILETQEPLGTSYVMKIEKIDKTEEDLLKLTNLVIENKAGVIKTYITEYEKDEVSEKVEKISILNNELEVIGSTDLPLEQQFEIPSEITGSMPCTHQELVEVTITFFDDEDNNLGTVTFYFVITVPCGSSGGGSSGGGNSGGGNPNPPNPPDPPSPPVNPPSPPVNPPPPPPSPPDPPVNPPPPPNPPDPPVGPPVGPPGGGGGPVNPPPVAPPYAPPTNPGNGNLPGHEDPRNVAIGILDDDEENIPETPCESLKSLSLDQNIKINDKIENLKTHLNDHNEVGYSVTLDSNKQPVYTYSTGALNAGSFQNAPNSVSSIHTHMNNFTDANNELQEYGHQFSIYDFVSYLGLHNADKDLIGRLDNAIEHNYPPEQTFSILVSQYGTFALKLKPDFQNHISNIDWITAINKYVNRMRKLNKLNIPYTYENETKMLLYVMEESGLDKVVSLYQANDTMTNWSEIKLIGDCEEPTECALDYENCN